MPKCQACGTDNVAGSAFCDTCGASLGQAVPVGSQAAPAGQAVVNSPPAPPVAATMSGGGSLIECPQCHFKNPATNLFCDQDGFLLAAQIPTTPAVPVSPAPAPTPLSAPLITHRQMKLVVASTGLEIPLPEKPEISVGQKDPGNGIFPDIDTTTLGGYDQGVSRRHCKILRQGEQVQVEDVGSVNGTYVNNVIVPRNQRQDLKNGDRLTLGQLTFTLHV